MKGLTCKALIDIFFFDELQNTTNETKNQGEDPYWLVKESFELKTTKRLQYYVVIWLLGERLEKISYYRET